MSSLGSRSPSTPSPCDDPRLKELSEHVDHIEPSSVRGDMQVQQVTLVTCWKRGRRLVEAECPWAAEILANLDTNAEIDILAPQGKDCFVDLDPDDIEDDEVAAPAGSTAPRHALSTDIEDAAEEELEAIDIATPLCTPATISHSITVDGQEVRKARVNFSACKTGLHPRKRACSGLGLDLGGDQSPSPAYRLASPFDGLASPFARLTPAKKLGGRPMLRTA
ncbi:hypothetical protein B0H14DRAFT_3675303 [Mycena olivaceomarginata]|nr:hypothetical protein B0H14DRAFT_3675303 [Mycena olivaceomarginata]